MGQLDCAFEHNPTVTLEQLKGMILEEVNILKKNNLEPQINILSEMARCKQVLEQKDKKT